MSHQFQIVFKSRESQYWCKDIKSFDFSLERERVFALIESYGQQNIDFFLKEFISLLSQDSKPDTLTEEVSQLSNDQLREKIKELLSEVSHLKSAKQTLGDNVSELSLSRANKEKWSLQSQVTKLQQDIKNAELSNSQLNRELLYARNQNAQERQNNTKYDELLRRWNELFPQFRTLEELANNISSLKEGNDKLNKSKQDLEKRFQEIEQEHQDAQQKLSVATTRLRGINVNPNLAGGGSRSDQLKNEFSNMKMGLFHDASSKVLNGWKDRGSTLTFRSEEFYKIKSILSQRVFCGGMAYFAKDKAEIDAAFNLIMEELSDIGSVTSTPILKEIQERIQAGLLRSKGIDNSDQALTKYTNEATKLIDQNLREIAKLETTGEAISEIMKFAESGLRLVRDIVNDPNSGELYMPESGAAFDESAHETRDEPRGQIKMTICAGYRVAGNVLVKADVITCEPESPSKKKEFNSSHSSDSQNAKEESEKQNSEATGHKAIENEAPGDSSKLPSQDASPGESISTDSQASSVQDISQNPDKNQQPVQQQESSVGTVISRSFTGKVTSTSGVFYRSEPHKDANSKGEAKYGTLLNFDDRTSVDSSEESCKEWYKLAGKDSWVRADFIEEEPPVIYHP